MVKFRTCDYTGEEIEPGTGTMYVKNDGKVLMFKDSKAEKNYLQGREPRDLEWIHKGQEQQSQRETGTTKLVSKASEKSVTASKDRFSEITGNTYETKNMDETVESVLRLLDTEHPFDANADSLRERAEILTEELKSSGSLNVAQVVASLGTLPVAPTEQRLELENEIRRFSDDIPIDPPEGSGRYEWEELYTEVTEFLEEKEPMYEKFREDGMNGVDKMKRRQLKAFLGDRLRYV